MTVLSRLLEHVVKLPNFPRDTLLNINLPPLRGDEIRGVRVTALGRRVYSDSLMRMKDSLGTRDLLDRRRLRVVVGSRGLGLPRDSGGASYP